MLEVYTKEFHNPTYYAETFRPADPSVTIYTTTLKRKPLKNNLKLKAVALFLKWRNLEQVKIRAPNLTEFNSMDHSYSKGLILVIFSHKTKSILIYEDPGEIVIPPSDDDKIFMVPMLRLETIIDNLLSERPNIMSILPCTSSILLQHELKEVSNVIDSAEDEMATLWYSWLKSVSLIDQVTNFMFKWK
nr:PREDICTED: uncharacterized protein LOC107782319 [Nicotiana tabacum]